MSASPSPVPIDVDAVDSGAADAPAPAKDNYDAFFGGSGSELSDDSEDERGPAVPKRKAFPPRPVAGDDDDDDDDEAHRPAAVDSDDDDDDDRESDGAYVPGTVNSAAKIPKFKKRRAGSGDVEMEGEEDDGEERSKERKKKKKSKHKGEKRRRGEGEEVPEEDDDAPALDAATQKRLELEARIDAIGKKSTQTKRKKKDDVDVVDTYHDEICARLRERMMHAVDKDRQSNENQMPATAKLAMLDEVMGVLGNSTLWTSVVDNGVLEAVRAWLEPMEATAALPAVGIQSALFEVLPKMDLDTATLKESRLGPIVLFYTKTKRVTPAISRAADALVQAWSRPIVKRPGGAGDFRSSRMADEGDGPTAGGSQSQSQSQGRSQSQGGDGGAVRRRRFDTATAIKENHGRKGARMPQVKETQYTVAPEPRMAHHEGDTAQVRKIASDNKKFNKFARQMRINKAR